MVLAAVSVFVIAAVIVGREAFRLGHQLPAVILDVDEAVAVVADELPAEVQGRLSYDEVRTLILAQLEHLREQGILGLPGEDPPALANGSQEQKETVVTDDDTVALGLGRLESDGLTVTDDDAYTVITSLHGYLRSIGAIGDRS